jgi:Bacterial dnaA  protein
VREEIVASMVSTLDLPTRVAILRRRAEQINVTLPTDAALYIAQNVRSNAIALETALVRLTTHSWATGTEITLAYTQHVLKGFIAEQARKIAVDTFRELLPREFRAKVAEICGPGPMAEDRDFFLGLLKTQAGRKAGRVRLELEVNMRESERERLARRDAYERELERRAKKRKQA